MYSSWCSCTTRVPKPAATRWRGSRLSSCTQLSSGSSGSPSRSVSSRCVSACQRPYSGAVISGSGSSSTSGRGRSRVGVVGRVRRVVVGEVDEGGQRALERVRVRLVPVLVALDLGELLGVEVRRAARAARRRACSTPPRSGSVMPGRLEPGRRHVDVAACRRACRPAAASAAARGTRSRPRRRCGSTSGGSTGMLARPPAAYAAPRPRTSRAARPPGPRPSPASRPVSNAGHDERVVGRVRREAPRADDARVARGRGSRRARPAAAAAPRAMSVGHELGVRAGERAVDVHVRPRPQLVGRRERREVARPSMNGSGRSGDVRRRPRTRPRPARPARSTAAAAGRPRPAPPACSATGSPRRRTRCAAGSWARSS